MSNRDRILNALAGSVRPLDDDQLSQRSGLTPRQTVNTICRQLAKDGVIRRTQGPEGKIVNRLVPTEYAADPPESESLMHPTPPRIQTCSTVETPSPEAGSSHEQRMAEAVMLKVLSESLGVELSPRRVVNASGSRVELDGANEDLTILVECWAHRGPAKVAQKYKLMNDAVKLHWVARSLVPPPDRLILCVSDPVAIRHLRGTSWQGAAIADLGVTLEVVELPKHVIASIIAAQKRQYR